MACTNPIKAWVHGLTDNLKPKYVFKRPHGVKYEEHHLLPCGKCVTCQIDKSKEWATRGFHESQCHTENSFITLTYSNEHLPEGSTLVKEHLVKFIKRLRDKIKPRKIKYLAAGEYGSPENSHRPHYHICIFGYSPKDKNYLFTNKHGDPVYTSEEISQLWRDKEDTEPKGYITVAPINYRTVAYVARYTLKKIVAKGKRTQEEYWVDKKTGETNYNPDEYRAAMLVKGKIPEYITMSKGIGEDWYKKYGKDTHKDYVTVNYMKHKVPKYYDKLLDRKEPERLAQIKQKRIVAAKEGKKTRQERRQEDKIKQIHIKQLKRSI